MRRAALLLAILLAGCGGNDGDSGPRAPATSAAVSSTPAATATATATKAPSASPRRRRRPAQPRREATPEPPPGAPVLGGAVQRYVRAIDLRDFGTLCSDFAAATGEPESEACSPERVRRLIAGRPAGPEVKTVSLVGRPRVTVRGRTARAVIRLAVSEATGRRVTTREELRLRLVQGRWIVARPSDILRRVVAQSTG